MDQKKILRLGIVKLTLFPLMHAIPNFFFVFCFIDELHFSLSITKGFTVSSE